MTDSVSVSDLDTRHMRLALDEARRGLGATSPNPPVGAVIAKDDKVLATGYHRRAGDPHAEIEAIAGARENGVSPEQLRAATLYVTLEPCSTAGKTPPCTDAIAEAGFSRVVFGAVDPNPDHGGRASSVLQGKGIDVCNGVLSEECAHLIRFFAKHVRTGLPFVIAKTAMTLDGRITLADPKERWITSATAREDVQVLRAEVDAILTGGETLRSDDPRLTLRGEFAELPRPQPWRVIQTRSGKLPKTSRVFTDAHKDRTLVFQSKSLRAILEELGKRGICSVLIEAGGNVMGQAFRAELVDEISFYVAPRIGGGLKLAVDGKGFMVGVSDMLVSQVGPDLKITGSPVYPNKDAK